MQWVTTPVKYLGVPLENYTDSDPYWRRQTEEIREKAAKWKGRDLSIFARATVCNLFFISKLWYVLQVLYCSRVNVQRLHRVFAVFIWENLVRPQNPGVLMAKRMGNTTNVIILFDGHYVPNYVKYGCVLAKCVLYRKRIDMCYQCGRLGHRADVCPNPNDKVCRGCGSENPTQDHECEAKCKLCGKNHPTADRKCEARYKLPYLVKKRRWERARREEEEAEAARSLHNAKETKGTYQNSQGPYGGKQSEYNKRDKSQDTRGRDRSGSFPRLNRREEGRSTSRNRSHSDKEEAHSSNGPGGPLQVSWANAVSGARAGAEAASQSKIRELEKELAQIRQMMVQYNQSNAALKEENRKLKEENNRIRKGMAENREVTQVVAEEREIDMEEDVATPAKRKATEDTVGNSEKRELDSRKATRFEFLSYG